MPTIAILHICYLRLIMVYGQILLSVPMQTQKHHASTGKSVEFPGCNQSQIGKFKLNSMIFPGVKRYKRGKGAQSRKVTNNMYWRLSCYHKAPLTCPSATPAKPKHSWKLQPGLYHKPILDLAMDRQSWKQKSTKWP